jgi:trk system potassium uptake protein TrkH
MFIGGAPGSTACGIKSTTFAVMVLTIVCVYRRKKHVECFGRRIEASAIRDASCVTTLYLIVVIVSTILICAIDDLELVPVLFEVVSAISSCGLSMGITTQLSDISCALITLIMFFGRIGGITFIVSLSSSPKQSKVLLPEEKIFIG